MYFMKNTTILFAFLAAILFGLVISSCSSTKEVTDPDIAWEEKQYNLAADLYEPRYKQTEVPRIKAEIAYKIAECHRFSNDTKQTDLPVEIIPPTSDLIYRVPILPIILHCV